jgi:hypothetical protein
MAANPGWTAPRWSALPGSARLAAQRAIYASFTAARHPSRAVRNQFVARASARDDPAAHEHASLHIHFSEEPTMSTNESAVRELSVDEQREIDGGVMEGGCISPIMQKILDIINGIGQP